MPDAAYQICGIRRQVGKNYKTASDSKITLHTKIITGNKKIGKMNRNATYNDWKWIFQKTDENGKWQLISDGYTP